MSYERGELELVTQATLNDTYNWEPGDELPRGSDAREANYQAPTPPYVQLPHSCDSWVIGGEVEIRALIHDLQDALVSIDARVGKP